MRLVRVSLFNLDIKEVICMCHGKCMVVKKIIFGLLLLLNAFLWPKWLGVDGWVTWIALLMVVFGAVMAVWPKCGCYSKEQCCEMPKKPAAAKKRKR